MTLYLFCGFAWSLLGCDADGDGLSNTEEQDLNLDANNADTDGDGLSDAEEVNKTGTDPRDPDTDDDLLEDGEEGEHGTDPLVADTDGDGYLDGAEVLESSDPTDPNDVIYQGGWPYFAGKDLIPGQDAATEFTEGQVLPRMARLEDQFGDLVDLHDFYDPEGPPLVIEVTTPECTPCDTLAAWRAGNVDPQMKGLDELRTALDDGAVQWITVLAGQDRPTVDAWVTEYPNDRIPVLADPDDVHGTFVLAYTYPTLYVLTSELSMYFRGSATDAGREVLSLVEPKAEADN